MKKYGICKFKFTRNCIIYNEAILIRIKEIITEETGYKVVAADRFLGTTLKNLTNLDFSYTDNSGVLFWKWKTPGSVFNKELVVDNDKIIEFESVDDAKLWFEIENL